MGGGKVGPSAADCGLLPFRDCFHTVATVVDAAADQGIIPAANAAAATDDLLDTSPSPVGRTEWGIIPEASQGRS